LPGIFEDRIGTLPRESTLSANDTSEVSMPVGPREVLPDVGEPDPGELLELGARVGQRQLEDITFSLMPMPNGSRVTGGLGSSSATRLRAASRSAVRRATWLVRSTTSSASDAAPAAYWSAP
jgi:hypothetical protein